MKTIFKEKIAVCYTCCGPTYRKSTLDKINNFYFDDPNIFYFVMTDDKKYFEGVNRKNFFVNELKDFYIEFPELKLNESYMESDSVEDYGRKFVELNYKFPYSTSRFHLRQLKDFNITHIAILDCDTTINLPLASEILDSNKKNLLYNAVSVWLLDVDYVDPCQQNMMPTVKILNNKYNMHVDKTVFVYDAAARFFIFENSQQVNSFFEVWNDVISTLYQTGEIKSYFQSYVVMDVNILAPIYNAFNLKRAESPCLLFDVKHNSKEERFWAS